MKYPGFTYLLFIAWGLSHAFGQTSDKPPLKNPVLHRTPDMASWTIQFTYESRAASTKQTHLENPNQIKSLTVIKTNKTIWIQTLTASGKKDEKWIFDGKELETVNDGKTILIVPPPTPANPSPDYTDFSKSDFEGLGWLSLATYKGAENYQGRYVYRFEAKNTGQTFTAFLSADTQLPLYSSDGEVSRTYTYNPPPTALLVPPKKFLDVLDTYKRGVEALKYHPSLP